MLQNTDTVLVENRSNSIAFYRVPESNIVRRFVGHESKQITMGELRQAIQIPGTKSLIEDNLIIHSQEAVAELLPYAEIEYTYNEKDVDFLLEAGSLDQLLDALDFAPTGVVDLIKDRAVQIELNDMRKRKAIFDKTNFDVTGAIEIKRQSAVVEEPTTKVRRTAPLTGETPTESAPQRRAAATTSKYRVAVTENK